MTVRQDGPAVTLVCDTCQKEAIIPPVHDWGLLPELAGWIDITAANKDSFHFCSREHAAAWRAGKGRRRKIVRVVEYGTEVKEIEL